MRDNRLVIHLDNSADTGLVQFEPLWNSDWASVTPGQPHNDLTYIESTTSQITMTFSAGRCGSTDVADWFLHTPIPESDQPYNIICIGEREYIPTDLNFAFCGTLSTNNHAGARASSNVCFGQGHWPDWDFQKQHMSGEFINGWCVKYASGSWTRTSDSASNELNYFP